MLRLSILNPGILAHYRDRQVLGHAVKPKKGKQVAVTLAAALLARATVIGVGGCEFGSKEIYQLTLSS